MEGGKAHSCCYWTCAGFPTFYFGWEVTPDHLLCTPDHPLRNPTMHPSLGMRSEERPIAIQAFLLSSSLSLTFDKISTRNSPSSSKTPTPARFSRHAMHFYSHLELSSRVRSRISQGRLSVTWRLQPGKFSRRPEPGGQPTNLIGVASRYSISDAP